MRRLECLKSAEQIPQNKAEPSWNSVATEVDEIDLVKVDGVWLAKGGTLTLVDALVSGRTTKRVSIARREEIKINPAIPDGIFGIPNVPQGTKVLDLNTRTFYYVDAARKLVPLGKTSP